MKEANRSRIRSRANFSSCYSSVRSKCLYFDFRNVAYLRISTLAHCNYFSTDLTFFLSFGNKIYRKCSFQPRIFVITREKNRANFSYEQTTKVMQDIITEFTRFRTKLAASESNFLANEIVKIVTHDNTR